MEEERPGLRRGSTAIYLSDESINDRLISAIHPQMPCQTGDLASPFLGPYHSLLLRPETTSLDIKTNNGTTNSALEAAASIDSTPITRGDRLRKHAPK